MENNELFQMKNKNFIKALNREETDYVPNVMSSSGGTIFWTGKTVYDVMHDPVLYAQALTDVLGEIWVDASAMNAFTTTPGSVRPSPVLRTVSAPTVLCPICRTLP